MHTLKQLFDDALPALLHDYTVRPGQIDLAEQISGALEEGSIAMFEAGTGTGKTLSYLLPVLMGNGPFLVSTGTKNLQDQLYLKDLPMLSRLFPEKRVALLKGRANYLCPRRLKRHIELEQRSKSVIDDLLTIRQWWSQTATGDLGEILDMEEKPHLAPLVTSTRDNCLGSRCPDYAECPLYRARQKASEADVVVVNHHLLFADIAQREDHLHSLLPAVKGIVLDEAHQVPDTARLFFGQRLSSGQLTELARDVETEQNLLGRDDPETDQINQRFLDSVKRLLDQVLQSDETNFSSWLNNAGRRAIDEVDEQLSALADRLAQVGQRSDGLAQCARRALACLDQFALLSEVIIGDEDALGSRDYAHWLERGDKRFVLHLSPLSIASDMKDVIEASGAAWVFTSATLTVDRSFKHFATELGVEAEVSAQFDSPFNFDRSVKAWIPPDLPLPGDDLHTQRLIHVVLPLIRINQGRTFVLFTSYRALRLAHSLLMEIDQPLFVQGHGSKSKLIADFRQSSRAILLATQSFWEGVDVSGADLRLLVIDKLPFPNPSDPLFKAQSETISEAGGNSFAALALPRAIISLKQGFGRLIRNESDQGVFVLGDVRMRQRPYGKLIRDNLPPMVWEDDVSKLDGWLKANMAYNPSQ